MEEITKIKTKGIKRYKRKLSTKFEFSSTITEEAFVFDKKSTLSIIEKSAKAIVILMVNKRKTRNLNINKIKNILSI